VAFYIGRALEYAHARKMVHRNVTPHNILLGHQVKEAKLSDLLLASALEEDPTKPISAAGVPSESLAYMSPERTDGPDAEVDLRTDVYSLGATTFAMLAGRPPFEGSLVQELVQKIRLEAPPTFQSAHVQAPPALESIVRRMLAKRPQDRYPSMRECLRDLQKVAKQQDSNP
jgi:serine/threonine-protein kinase